MRSGIITTSAIAVVLRTAGRMLDQRRWNLGVSAQILAVAISMAALPAFVSASDAPTPVPSKCETGGTRPNVAALPPGTRVFFTPMMTVGYSRTGVQAAEAFYSSPPEGEVRAEVRDGAVYVNGQKSPAALHDGQPLLFRSRVQVCVYPPGAALPPALAGVTPDIVVR